MKNLMFIFLMIISFSVSGQKSYNFSNFDEKIMDSLFMDKVNSIRVSNKLIPLYFDKYCYKFCKIISNEFNKNPNFNEINYDWILDSIYNEHQVLNMEKKSIIEHITIIRNVLPINNETYDQTINYFFYFDDELNKICLNNYLNPKTIYSVGVKFEMVGEFYRMVYTIVIME